MSERAKTGELKGVGGREVVLNKAIVDQEQKTVGNVRSGWGGETLPKLSDLSYANKTIYWYI